MKTTVQKIAPISLLLFCLHPLFSQELTKREFNKAFEDADISYYYEEDYETAARLYESLSVLYPENSNLCAKLGICYLNLDGKKADALKYLKKASTNVVSSEKEYVENGEKAPLDTYLYLAIAYHQNDSLQKAISAFGDARNLIQDNSAYREIYIDNQIRDCRYALEMKKKPLTIISELFAPWLDEYPGACNPVLAKNDSVFIFTLKQEGKTSVLCSYKSGTWKRPVDITSQLGGYDRFYTNSITGDGRLLIIYMDDGGDGNLYYSQRKDSTWTKIKSLGRPVNSIYWESHGFITPDGNSLYIATNRPGGQGELDIWISEKSFDGEWKQPVNCGDVINTPYDENYPFYDPSANALIFCSSGHISMGGYDVFRSINRNGIWTNPVGMPFAFNNSADNTFFILNNNAPGFITSIYDEKINTRNIYAIVAEDPAEKITIAQGKISLQDGMSIDPKQTSIRLAELNNRVPIKTISLADADSFNFEIKPGDYQLFVSHTGYKTDTINLNVPLYYLGNYVSVDATLIPDKVFGGDFLSIKNILFDFDSFVLNDQAISSIELLKTILTNYPDLQIEIAGYTDAIGSTEYNRRLADKRAQEVIDYLTASGISGSRFVKKAFGESNFVAINSNRDGSDNPEGRMYNRRVTFGIVDPQTGVVIRQETYTPERLREPFSLKYSIVLAKTKEKLYPGYFSGLIKNDLLFVRSIKADTLNMYVLGVFYNRSDALQYLAYARDKGLTKAYILNQYDLDNESKGITNPDGRITDGRDLIQVYTVQIGAYKNPININRVFAGLEGVTEVRAEDGLYRYYYGEFKALSQAKQALLFVKKEGYDAFIRLIDVPVSQNKP
jgi:outer membrane protein OmpA-like peptidoglycan-associated protein/tetratricopeptide (TPR) repeat protein